MQNLKIASDARWSIGDFRGMGRFTRFFIKPVEEKILAFGSDGQKDKDLNVITKGKNFYPYWEQIVLPALCRQNKVDILVCPYNTAPIFHLGNCKLILVVHDLIFMESFSKLPLSNSFYQNLGRIYRRLILPLVINKAEYIITVSEFSKKQIIHNFNIDENRIKVFSNTLSEEWFTLENVPIRKRSKYIYCVSGEGPSKNLMKGLMAYYLLVKNKKIKENLIIAGVRKEYRKSYNNFLLDKGIEDRVFFLDFISDEEMKQYYQNARLFFFPSLIEGFGIPLIEAMATGVPIACSNSSCFPEVTQGAALYFDPHDTESIADTLYEILTDEVLSTTLQEKGFTNVRRYHIEVFMKQVHSFWNRVINV